MALWIAFLNCLTNQLLFDFVHATGPLLPVNNTSPKKKEKKKEGKSCFIVQIAINMLV